MDIEENDKKSKSKSKARSRGRGGRGRTRGRTKKAVKVIESDDEDLPQSADENAGDGENTQEVQNELTVSTQPAQPAQTPSSNVHHQYSHQTPQQQVKQLTTQHHHHITHHVEKPHFDLEADISKLEAPTFTTINRGPPEPMLRLRWDHRVNLIGEKVLNPMIHCCDKCLKPILIYGRMIPCKHVFCLMCAKREDKSCPRCMEKVTRVEQTGLGTVFMCTHGGTRYGNSGCRRTYLSHRDLQAHINHRHVTAAAQQVQAIQLDNSSSYMQHKSTDHLMDAMIKPSASTNRIKPGGALVNDPRVSAMDHRQSRHYPSTSSSVQNNSAMRSNLITVPIQDTNSMEIQSSLQSQQQQSTHHYYHGDNHVNPNMTARHIVMSSQAPQAQVAYGYAPQSASSSQASSQQNPQYYGQPHTNPLSYVSPGQQAYVQPQQPRGGSYPAQAWPQQQSQQPQQFYR